MEGRLLYLTQADVAALDVPMAAIIDAVHAAFLEKGAGRVEMPPKPGVHPGAPEADNFIHAMPAYIPALRSVGVKWVSGYPDNVAHGLPYINGLIILNDPDTGVPTAVMDCTWITAKRTAAASAVSARYLARPDSAVLGVLGCGVQGRSHVEALTIVLPGIKRVVAYDVDLKRAQAFADEIEQHYGIQARAVPEPREAVRGADVVVTAGPVLRVPHATIKAGWLEPGTFASAVDFDSYFDGAALHECAKFTTDDLAQLLHFRDMGYFQSVPAVYAELADLVAGRVPGRQSAEERTMALNLGIALEDMAVAPLVYAKAQEAGVGRWLPL